VTKHLARGLVGLALALGLSATVLWLASGTGVGLGNAIFIWAITIVFAATGLLIASRHPGNAIGWLFLGAAPPRRGMIALAWGLTLLVWGLSVAAFVFLVLDRASKGSEFLPAVLSLAVPCAYAAVGGLVATRRRGNRIGWICLAIGLIWAVAGLGDAVTGWAHHEGHLGLVEWAGLTGSFWLPAVGLSGQLALRLPNGHLLSSRWRWFAWFCVGLVVLIAVVLVTEPGRVADVAGTENPIGSEALHSLAPLFALMPLCVLGPIASLVLRYRRAGGVERLQLRWIALGGLVLFGVGLTVFALVGVTGSLSPGLAALDDLGNLAIPITIGIAVLRYRLYDIDVVINRTLVYGALTATLAGAYLGSVLLLQLALSGVTGGSGLAVAASTLAVAALFRPARRRIQVAVDHRFYRRKYDAQHTLEEFAVRLRNEVDLEALNAQLGSVVRETFQPAHVSLWLRRQEQGS
jgi:hypothetical protein